jgi:hypothetical protein
MLAVAALLVLATGIGAAYAFGNRQATDGPAAVATPASLPATPTSLAPQPVQAARPQPVQAAQPRGHATTVPARPAVVLSDGRHEAFIRRIDTGRRTMVVDVVQVFHDQAAVDAAIQDGKSHAEAQYLTTWVRNQSSRLRTLPYASDLRINLRGSCEEQQDQGVLLARLAKNASLGGVYYYTLTVDRGTVQQVDEHLAINAC